MEEERWRYRVVYRGGVHVRASPSLDGPLVGTEVLEYGEEFMASKSMALDGVIYVKLADGRGWVFEKRGPEPGALEVLELLKYEPGSRRAQRGPIVVEDEPERGLFLSNRASIERTTVALAKAQSLEDVVATVSRSRVKPRGAELATTRKLAAMLEAKVDVQHFPEVVWWVAKLEYADHHRLVDAVAADAHKTVMASSPQHTSTSAAIFKDLGHRFHNLAASLVDPSKGDYHYRLPAFVQAWIILKLKYLDPDFFVVPNATMTTTTTPTPMGVKIPTPPAEEDPRCGAYSFFSVAAASAAAAVEPPSFVGKNYRPLVAAFSESVNSLFATGEQCLSNPDIQFALAF